LGGGTGPTGTDLLKTESGGPAKTNTCKLILGREGREVEVSENTKKK